MAICIYDTVVYVKVSCSEYWYLVVLVLVLSMHMYIVWYKYESQVASRDSRLATQDNARRKTEVASRKDWRFRNFGFSILYCPLSNTVGQT